MFEMTTFLVYGRNGNRWTCIGSFDAPNSDANRKEGLRNYLHQNGLFKFDPLTGKIITNTRKYSARKQPK